MRLDPLDFISRLAALVPPPRKNGIRYHGALAPNAKLRSKMVLMAPPRLASARGHKRPNARITPRQRMLWADSMAHPSAPTSSSATTVEADAASSLSSTTQTSPAPSWPSADSPWPRPLQGLPNVILMPHIGGSTPEA